MTAVGESDGLRAGMGSTPPLSRVMIVWALAPADEMVMLGPFGLDPIAILRVRDDVSRARLGGRGFRHRADW